MTKELFLRAIEEIQNHRRKENKFLEALDVLSQYTSNEVFLYGDYETLVIDILEQVMNDEDTIAWWIYETDFGKEERMNKIEVDGKLLVIDTAEKLYNYLVEHK